MSSIITIDGTAGSGKGTLAKMLAEKLGFVHLDTGLLYRAVALNIHEQQLDVTDISKLTTHAVAIASSLVLPIRNCPELRTPEIARIASKIASLAEVRQALLPLQQNFANHPPPPSHGVVLDGRDTGSVVCPDAHAKLYLEASVDVRAKRRYLELHQSVPLEQIKRSIIERDSQDRNRLHAPLIIPPLAKIIDTSHLSPTKTLEICLAWLKSLGMIQLLE